MGNTVYYYCNVQTGHLVLKNREVWMTDIRNLNDSNEGIGVYTLFLEMLERYDHEHLKKHEDLWRIAAHQSAIRLYGDFLEKYPDYVVCFSKDKDSVSKWCMYADDGCGMAVGFDEDDLKGVVNDFLSYKEIKYICEEDLEEIVEEAYEKLEKSETRDFEKMELVMGIIKKAYPDGNGYKLDHYKSEQETRLVYTYRKDSPKTTKLRGGWDLREIDTYTKKNMINTYIPMGFPRSAVKEIVLGPKYQKNYYEFEHALEVLGYDVPDIAVSKSKSRYR